MKVRLDDAGELLTHLLIRDDRSGVCMHKERENSELYLKFRKNKINFVMHDYSFI